MDEIGKVLPALFKKQIGRSEPHLLEILTPLWPRIVGRIMAEHSQPAAFASRFRDHHFPDGIGPEPASLEIISQLGQEDLLAPDGLDVIGGLPIHQHRADRDGHIHIA